MGLNICIVIGLTPIWRKIFIIILMFAQLNKSIIFNAQERMNNDGSSCCGTHVPRMSAAVNDKNIKRVDC